MFRPEVHLASLRRDWTNQCRPLLLYAGWFAAALVLFAGAAPVAQAQVSTAAVVGTMTDRSGAAVVGVKVTATNIDTGLTYKPAAPISVLGAPGFGRVLTFTGNRQQQIALKILF